MRSLTIEVNSEILLDHGFMLVSDSDPRLAVCRRFVLAESYSTPEVIQASTTPECTMLFSRLTHKTFIRPEDLNKGLPEFIELSTNNTTYKLNMQIITEPKFADMVNRRNIYSGCMSVALHRGYVYTGINTDGGLISINTTKYFGPVTKKSLLYSINDLIEDVESYKLITKKLSAGIPVT